ncbi:hypothetical protein NIES2101_10400 [Calothrix sp. HK-06]|nr:hypothetical protein NIES2101_10400 [Calothrix sp. HK-06]
MLFQSLFSLEAFIPHGHCYLWKPRLLGLHLTSDLLIAIAYYSIPILLINFVSQRQDFPYKSILVLFSAFIVACGTTHVLDIWTLWHPTYWLSGLVKAITALVSISTVLTLIPMIPKLLALRSPHQLEKANIDLQHQITERKLLESALRQSELRYRAILEDQTELIARYQQDGTVTFVNEAYCQYFGQARSELVGHRYEPVVFEADRARVAQLINSIDLSNPVVIGENRVVVNGKVRWTQWVNRGLFNEQGDLVELQAVGRDIHHLKQMEEALFEEKEIAQVTLHSIGDAVITTDGTGNVVYLNPVAENLTGWKQQDAYGLSVTQVFKIINAQTGQFLENPVNQALQQGQIIKLANDALLIDRNGGEIAIDNSAAPICNREGKIIGAVMVFRDMTENRLLSEQLAWQASHDTLTGLFNRREFEQRLEVAFFEAKNQNGKHILCYLDLDRFKIVNDTCGHMAGDEVLQQVTKLLQKGLRKIDVLARLGGDEFGLLLHQCSLETAVQIVNDIREQLHEFQFTFQGKTFFIGVSIGLVEVNAQSESTVSVLSSADAACYAAKKKGRNRIHIFQSDDEELLLSCSEVQWVARLTQALWNDSSAKRLHERLCLYYQPIAAITPTGLEIDHYEVLLRLLNEHDNVIPATAFISSAERYDLMRLIDRWVIRTFFREWSLMININQLYKHRTQKIFTLNLSGDSINDNEFITFLYEQFEEHNVLPESICFEITETVAITNLTKANQLIQELQQIGCSFALDDFGSGMCSFNYLRNLSVDYLKINGELVKNIADNPVDAAIVKAITQIGHVMGVKIIAESVENNKILERIQTLKIDYAQGYLIGTPSLCVQT